MDITVLQEDHHCWLFVRTPLPSLTPTVFERYSGGESLQDIADDYDLAVTDIEEALRCEMEQRAA